MRATLSDPALTRQAGRFVWLELDFDKPGNQAFIASRGARYTPTLYVLDPADERVTATHIGGLTLAGLNRFLEEGERSFQGKASSPADAALARGDELLGQDQPKEAAAACREALGLAPPGWPERAHAVCSLTWSLWRSSEAQACAETAAVEAPRLPRGEAFGAVVLAGFSCASRGGEAAWAQEARKTLEPLAEEAVVLPSALRDHRFQIYQTLIRAAQMRSDTVTAARWSHRWLDEIDAISPKDDDERSALDIARVDAVVDDADLPRVIAALIASERAMPTNYNASMKLAEAEVAARRFEEAAAACDRGLAHVTGPVGRCWLLRSKAEALLGGGDKAGARRALELALQSAQEIKNPRNRDSEVRRATQQLAGLDPPGK